MPHNPNSLHFANPSQLASFLQAHQINLSLWGAGNAKSVADLWQELQVGDALLQATPPQRIVHTVSIIIKQGDLQLIEVEQLLKDGRTRRRNRPPSEKMKATENYEQAALRCLHEELDVSAENIHIVPNTHQLKTETIEAHSYPTLNTTYHIHTIQAKISNLPSEPFETHNAASAEGDPVLIQRWAWLKQT